ncbi:MAG: hypothetical protein IJ801_07480 [Lachnospiraceae bacterium]|nr:hypothetical protein [Lachnospiraceae bacterium]
MAVLGVLVIIVGVVLILVGRNMTRHLPPDYREEGDGFLELLQGMGNLLGRAGGIFVAAGIVCMIVEFF